MIQRTLSQSLHEDDMKVYEVLKKKKENQKCVSDSRTKLNFVTSDISNSGAFHSPNYSNNFQLVY